MIQTTAEWPGPLQGQAFFGLEKLKQASATGKNAAAVLQRHDVLGALADFDPVIAGTLPIGINIDQSDIDILCHAQDLGQFSQLVDDAFEGYPGYRSYHREKTTHVGDARVVRFYCDGFDVEIFATNCQTTSQYGFIHMLTEARLIAILGPDFAERIRTLKRQNIKTEPAFAKALNLSGDPYIAVGTLASLSMPEMCTFLTGKGLSLHDVKVV